jgi:hypothetical protein
METRREERQFYNLEDQAFGDEIRDEELRAAFKVRYDDLKEKELKPPQQTLLSVYHSRNWSQEDLSSLASLSVDDFYRIFKSVRGDDLARVINGALYFRSVRGPSPEADAA